ncbi:hypothetical protein [Neomegalonema sp.]|uniref:hypothetical protein n=1 Tax=Neomegalonema sp. TaxID=2039713 RepID=UPI0026196596|nr:hypothetical protein [Neomegalonema sp.]MDD2867438.1 hypothetical protein [Neomegalonema sp.]
MTGRGEEEDAAGEDSAREDREAREGGSGKGGPSPKEDSRTPVLIALCAAGFALFNFPLLALWDSETEIFGLPLTPVALFVIWGGLIAALAWALERRRP